LAISGLGLYEAYLNGKKINDYVLSIAPYDFGKSVPYQVHDVTALIQNGTNGIGVILGNGYFNPVVPSLLREYAADFIDTPRLRCELGLEYADGTTELIPSDDSWRFTTSGPIRFNSIRAGESYDARKELGDWTQGHYQDATWLPAQVAQGPAGRMRTQALPPVRTIKTIPAVSVIARKDGCYRFDIGVECTGWARIKVHGKAGQKIILSYPGSGSHTLGRYQTFEYICKGEGEEIYEPRFAFNGYQFVDVQGLDYKPNLSDLVGCQVVSDLKGKGTFACSDERLNRLHAVNLRTLLNYYIQMPMDPVREKVCWTQDVQTDFETSAYNFDVEAIYKKWQEDFVDAILPNGYVPTVVPSCFDGPTINGPWWGGMIIYNPWQHYQFYGDKTILSKSYPAMKSQFAYLSSLATNNVIAWGLGDWMDVASGGNGRPKGTTVPFTSTCAYLMYADILQETAKLLDETNDAALFAKRGVEIRETINQKFYEPVTGAYDKGSQTSFILALKLNIVPQAERTKLVQKFAERIAQDKDHLSTGFVGTPFLLTMLNEEGLGDLAWKMATQETYPSWFDMVFKNNLSVFRENWQGGLVQMPSLAGPIGAWFYRSLGGIRPGKPGFKEVIIEPYTKTLEWVDCNFEGPYGTIASNWKKTNGTFEMKLTIPANTTATVYLPAASLDSMTEGGQALDKAPGIAVLRMEAERAVLRVASGHYTFVSRVTK
jgi:alpha-L-rhamnosidase